MCDKDLELEIMKEEAEDLCQEMGLDGEIARLSSALTEHAKHLRKDGMAALIREIGTFNNRHYRQIVRPPKEILQKILLTSIHWRGAHKVFLLVLALAEEMGLNPPYLQERIIRRAVKMGNVALVSWILKRIPPEVKTQSYIGQLIDYALEKIEECGKSKLRTRLVRLLLRDPAGLQLPLPGKTLVEKAKYLMEMEKMDSHVGLKFRINLNNYQLFNMEKFARALAKGFNPFETYIREFMEVYRPKCHGYPEFGNHLFKIINYILTLPPPVNRPWKRLNKTMAGYLLHYCIRRKEYYTAALVSPYLDIKKESHFFTHSIGYFRLLSTVKVTDEYSRRKSREFVDLCIVLSERGVKVCGCKSCRSTHIVRGEIRRNPSIETFRDIVFAEKKRRSLRAQRLALYLSTFYQKAVKGGKDEPHLADSV